MTTAESSLKKLLLLTTLALTINAQSQITPYVEWVVPFESSRVITGILNIHSDGSIFQAGQFYDTVDLDPGPGKKVFISPGDNDAYLVKLDKDHNLLWAHHYDVKHHGGAFRIGSAIDNLGNHFVVMNFRDTFDINPGSSIQNLYTNFYSWDMAIVKFDSSGNFIFAKQIHGLDSFTFISPSSINTDKEGNIIVTGLFSPNPTFKQSNFDFDPGPNQYIMKTKYLDAGSIFILKLASDGSFKWAKQIDVENSTAILSGGGSHVSDSGDIYGMAIFTGKVDADPGPGKHILQSFSSTPYLDTYSYKLDNEGIFQWAYHQSMGQSGLTSDSEGNAFISGHFKGQQNFNMNNPPFYLNAKGMLDTYFLKLDQTGQLKWVKQIESKERVYPYASNVDQHGNYYLTGSFTGSTDFDPGLDENTLPFKGNEGDGFVAKYDNNGNNIWAMGLTSEGLLEISSISTDEQGYIYTGGIYSGETDFNPRAGKILLDPNFGAFIQKLYEGPVGIEKSAFESSLEVRPNPIINKFEIRLSSPQENIQIELIDVNGHAVFHSAYRNLDRIQISRSGLRSGMYLLKVVLDTETITRKIIVQ